MKSIGKLLTMALVALMWSPMQAAYRISEEQRSKPLPIPPGLGQYERPNRPVPPAPKPKESEAHTPIDRGPTIPLDVTLVKKQETPQEMAQRTQDLERLKRMQRIEKTLGLETELRPQAEAGAEGGKGVYKAEWTSSGSSGVKNKLAQEDREALRKEYDELKKIDEQRRAEIRAKAAEPIAKDEAVVAFEQAPARMKPSEAAAAQRSARKQPSDEISARDLKRMGRDEALNRGKKLEEEAQDTRPPVPPRPLTGPAALQTEQSTIKPSEAAAQIRAKRAAATEEPQNVSPKDINRMGRNEALRQGAELEAAPQAASPSAPLQEQREKSLKEKFFTPIATAKDTMKEAAQNFKSKIFNFFGGSKKTQQEPTDAELKASEEYKKLVETVQKRERDAIGKTTEERDAEYFAAQAAKKTSSETAGMTEAQLARYNSPGQQALRRNAEKKAAEAAAAQEVAPNVIPLAPPPPAGMTEAQLARYNSPGQQALRRNAEKKAAEEAAAQEVAPASIPLPPPLPVTEKVPPPTPATRQDKASLDRPSLLAEIEKGTQLKPVETTSRPEAVTPRPQDDIQTSLAAAIQARRKNMKEDEKEKRSSGDDWY
jgi:hypothetical protein